MHFQRAYLGCSKQGELFKKAINAMRYKHMRKCEVGLNDATHELVAENHVITSKTKGKEIN